MPWGRWDDQLYDNGKVSSFSDKAYRLWGNSISYANRHRTGGRLTYAQVNVLTKPIRATQRTVEELVAKGGWETVEGGYAIHDFLKYNDTPEAIEARTEARAAAGRLGGKRSGETRRSKAEANASRDASEANEANANPVPVTRTNPVLATPQRALQVRPSSNGSPPPRATAVAPVPKVSPQEQARHGSVFRALCERFGKPANDAEGAKYGKAAKLLAQSGATGEEVFELADRAEQRWDGAEVTPLGIASNVTSLRGAGKARTKREAASSQVDRVFQRFGT